MFENVREDLKRAGRVNGGGPVRQLLCPGTQAVLAYRLGHWLSRLRVPGVRHLLLALYKPFHWCIRLLTGVYIATGAEIGPGLVVHTWSGVFVPPSRMGRNVTLHHGVIINYDCRHIGDDVNFGPGAKVVKPVRIGNRVRIGANAVVWQDIPDDCSVMGIPGKIIRLRGGRHRSLHAARSADGSVPSGRA